MHEILRLRLRMTNRGAVHEILRLRLRMTNGRPVHEVLRLRLRMTNGRPVHEILRLRLRMTNGGAVHEVLRLRLRMTNGGPAHEILRLRLRMTNGGACTRDPSASPQDDKWGAFRLLWCENMPSVTGHKPLPEARGTENRRHSGPVWIPARKDGDFSRGFPAPAVYRLSVGGTMGAGTSFRTPETA